MKIYLRDSLAALTTAACASNTMDVILNRCTYVKQKKYNNLTYSTGMCS